MGIYCLDVGQGDCTFIVAPDNQVVLFDCADSRVARRFLSDLNLKRIDSVVVSHQDFDHIKGIAPLLRGLLAAGGTIGEIWIDDDRPQLTKAAQKLFDYSLELNSHKKARLRVPTREESPKPVIKGNDWSVDLLLPTPSLRLQSRRKGGSRGAPNLTSVALQVRFGGASVLIGGDAPLGAWEKVAADGTLNSNVFRVPHHGGRCDEGRSKWTGYDDLYSSVHPTHAIVSVGTVQPGGYGHPIPDHVKAVRRVAGCRLICTQLTTRCHKDPASLRSLATAQVGAVGYDWRHHGGNHPREVPCAGSVLIVLHESGAIEVEPDASGWHKAWVEKTIGDALCRKDPAHIE